MNPNGKALALPLQQSTFGIQDYLEIFWRRKWWLVVPLLLGTVIAVVYSYTLPPLYRSSTLILVEPQEVPPSYVSSLVTSSVEERLATIRQQVMSRTNLEKIIREFGLYREPQAQPVSRGLMGRVRTKAKRLLQSLGLYREPPTVVPERGHIPEEVIARMRSSIEVEVLGGRRSGHNAFTISFRGENPQTVMQVTNALASLFIEENLKVRERQAEGTAEFLESQLREAARDLQRQEQALKEFKERHRGALPEQLDANLRTLDRLQQELQSLNEALRTAEEQALLLERQLAELQQAETPQASAPEAPAVPLERELQQLRGQLALLQAQFNDNYPDILILKRRIAELEAQRGTVPEAPSGGELAPAASSPRGAQQLELQLHALRSDIAALTARRQQVQALIREYERRVEETPDNELKLLTLTRNYAISQKNYETLLAKRLNAKLAESLEKRQKGEQFRILDPANLPTRPYWPDRPRIVLLGSLLSGGLGAAFIIVLEQLRPRLRKPGDLQRVAEAPVLAAIPRARCMRKGYRLVAVDDPEGLITEQYRLLYARLEDLKRDKGHQVFAISSAVQGEGKTVTALNLAVVMARDFGQKTLLLEGDFKRPVLTRYLKTELQAGLVDLLVNQPAARSSLVPFADIVIPFADDNLAVLPAVRRVRNSSGLLNSQQMRDLLAVLRTQYDYILIDAAPVLPLSDMAIFEEVVDGVVLVVRAEKTPRAAVSDAVQTLAAGKLAGFVLNDVRQPVLLPYYRYSYEAA